MGNLFDTLQDTAFNVVTNTMGYDVSWTPAAGGSAITAKVLYNGPTEKEKLADADFHPESIWMEFKKGDLPGLKESADDNVFETVVITGISSFKVKSITEKYDGKTLIAKLDKIDS